MKYESFKKQEYLLNISQRTISQILNMVNIKILWYHDLIVYYLVGKRNHDLNIHDVLSAYLVFDKKKADNYFEQACISCSISQKIACDIILDK